MESEQLGDLLPVAFEPTDTGLQAYVLPGTPLQTISGNSHQLISEVMQTLTVALRIHQQLIPQSNMVEGKTLDLKVRLSFSLK